MAEVGTWQWLRDLLRNVGLEDLFDEAKNGVTAGSSDAEVWEVLRGTNQFRTRFSAIFEREAAGLPPITAGQIVEHERQLRELAAFYGFEPDPGQSWQELANQTIAGDVSVNEMQSRFAAYRDVADRIMEDPANTEIVDQVLSMGGTPMDLARAVVEPGSLPAIEQRLRAASIALEANRAGRGLTTQQAMMLSQRGLTGDQAEQGFQALAANAQIVDPITGETGGGVGVDDELAALTGDANAQRRIAQATSRRRAAFQGGGQFATDDEGYAGLA